MVKIAIINQKGGVGKTTSAVNIGAGLSKLNKKVLLVDLDPQSHLTYSLGIPAHELERSIYNFLKGETTLEEVLVEKNERLKVIPSTLNLSGAETEFTNTTGREYLLKNAMGNLRGFDYVIIDCPPSLGILTVNALTYAQEVIYRYKLNFWLYRA